MRENREYFRRRFRNGLGEVLSTAGLSAEVFIWDNFHDRYLISNLVGISLPNGFDTTTAPGSITRWIRLGRNDRDDIRREFNVASRRHELLRPLQGSRRRAADPEPVTNVGPTWHAPCWIDTTMPEESNRPPETMPTSAEEARVAQASPPPSKGPLIHRHRNRELQGHRCPRPHRPPADHPALRPQQRGQEHHPPGSLLCPRDSESPKRRCVQDRARRRSDRSRRISPVRTWS